MADTGWLNPGSVVSQAPGDAAWTDPANAEAEDSSFTNAGIGAAQASEALYASDFGAALPSGATVDGVEIRVVRYFVQDGGSVANVNDFNVQLTPGGAADGETRASDVWPQDTPGAFIHGGAADLWGCTLNQSIVNNTNFGVVFACSENDGVDNAVAYVDVIQMRITYTASSGGKPAQYYQMMRNG